MTRVAGRITAALLLALSAAPAMAQQPARPPADMDAYVQRVRETFDVPGIAVAVVKDGHVVLAKGYGVRDENRPEPVDAGTLFGIASNTKAFTATALGMLVEEGKLEWDAPVTRYLPGFALSDPYVTRELTVRDLLVHRSGLSLGAGDLLWWPANDLPRAELVRRLRHVPLSTSFRSTYAYDNVLYVAAGALIEEVSGQTWEEFVQRRILDRVGMRGSTPFITRGLAAPNVALPHAPVEGEVRRVKPFTGENGAPAAGIYSSVEDMARWMIVQLDSGRVGPKERLWSAATARQLWTPVTPMNIGTPQPELAATRPNFLGYALGFNAGDYRGQKTVTHTGGLPGYLTQVMLVPDLKLGIVVLTNQESGAAFRSITYRVMDHYMGAPRTDWVAA